MTAVAAMQSCIKLVGAFWFSWILRRELWVQNLGCLFWQTACCDGLRATIATHEISSGTGTESLLCPTFPRVPMMDEESPVTRRWVTSLRAPRAAWVPLLETRGLTSPTFYFPRWHSTTLSPQIATSLKGSVWIKLLSKAHFPSPPAFHQHFLSSHLKKTALRTFQPKAAMWSLSCFRFTQALC